MNAHLEAALAYAARGLTVFPVEPRGKRPLTEHGLKDATDHPGQIRAWWEATPQANVGLPTSGLLVVDADVRADVEVRSGVDAWAELTALHGGQPPTRMQRTGSGGLQVFFRDPGRRFRNSAGKLGPNIDTRAVGGYVLVPPSLHPTGERYRWTSELPTAPLPAWLAALLMPPQPAPVGEQRLLQPGIAGTTYGEVALVGLEEEMRGTPKGARNQTLVGLAYRAGRLIEAGEIDLQVAEEALVVAACAAGLSEREAQRTFINGLTAGRDAGPAARRPRVRLRGRQIVSNGWSFPTNSAIENVYGESDKNDRRDFLSEQRGASVVSVVPPLPPRPAAFSGLGGRIVRAIEPHSEADPVGVLVSLLTGFGSAVGRGPHVMVGRTRHGTNLQTTLVGDSAFSRKGTSWADARWLLSQADEQWVAQRIVNGLVSGEGVIHHVRDEVKKPDEVGGEKIVDAGVVDKRLMCVEAEYGRVLTAGSRQGSTLLHVLRSAWDGDRLGNLTRNNPESATDAHISVLGHVTRAELLRDLTENDRLNGFANRVLWVYVRRSKELPFGGELPRAEADELAGDLRRALAHARHVARISWSDEGQAVWRDAYPRLTRERPGLTGAMLSRADAQVLRLALLYSLLGSSDEILGEHVEAALALWDYAERSVGFIFEGVLGDAVANAILAKLRRESPVGVSRTEIRDLFQRNVPAARTERALAMLAGEGLARTQKEETGGRPAELWFALVASDAPVGSDDEALEALAQREREHAVTRAER